MTSRENGTVRRRSLLSFASGQDGEAQVPPAESAPALRNGTSLDHYHRMRSLRLAAETDAIQPPHDISGHTGDEAAEQEAVNRMRADMAAIKAELNRRVDAAEDELHMPAADFDEPLLNQPRSHEQPVKTLPAAPEKPEPENAAEPSAFRAPVRHPQQDGPEPRTANYQDDEWKPLVDPRIVINRVGRSKGLILAATIIGTLLGVGYAMTLPKLYASTVEVLVDPRDLKIVDKEISPNQLPLDASLAVAESQLRIIQSSSVLTKVIERAGLAKDPEFNGDLKERGLLATVRELFSTDSTPDATTRETRLLRNLYDHLNVERSTKNYIFNITVNSRDPEKSAFIANTVSDVFREEQGNIQSDTARRATEALTARLNDLRAGVEQAENAVQKFKAENDLVDVQGRLINDDEITRTNDELTAARNQTIRLNAQAASIRSTSVEGVLGNTLPEEFRSGVIVALRSQYGALKQQADGLATKLGPRHPQLIQAQSQVSGIRTEIRNELQRIASSVQTELRRSRQQEQELTARLNQLKARTAANNEDMIKLRELDREVAAKREVYESFLLRAKETGELESVNIANIRVISPARPALESSGGSRKLVAIAGLLGGLFAGLGIAVMLGMLESFRAGNSPADPSPEGNGRRAARPVDDDVSSAGNPPSASAARRGQGSNVSAGRDAAVEDEIATAEFLYAYADAHIAPRPHDNSNIEEVLAEIEALREILRKETGRQTA
jgi:uncharacterized protein involved in exopolysaccharide biosynthesis